jgi:pimeloyl-ACP methyl ester carboxylesterase
MWPKRNTAFFVIHGAGAHRPFEALDLFVRGFWKSTGGIYSQFRDCWQHELLRRPDRVDHYLSLAPEGRPKLSFLEYYWDLHVDHKVGIQETIDWLEQVSDSARRYYSARPELALAHQRQGSDLFRDGDFRIGGYFVYFGWVGQLLYVMNRLGLARLPLISSFTAFALDRAASWISEMMGDLVIYTTLDVRSPSYAVRQTVLDAAVEELKFLLRQDDFDRVIVVGHSLGSLIAYDAVNRIIVDLNAGNGVQRKHARKLVGLVTFGSPLDKAAFFFRDRLKADAYMHQQILAQQNAFRRRPFPDEQFPVVIGNPSDLRLEGARWLNFYHLKDPIGGHLDAYDVDNNILCDAPVTGAVDAHSSYWFHAPMYLEMCRVFFQNPLNSLLPNLAQCG